MPKQKMTLRDAKAYVSRDAHGDKPQVIDWMMYWLAGHEIFIMIYSYRTRLDSDLPVQLVYRVQMWVDGMPRVGDILGYEDA
jgi:hypothetical protein